jgi:bifunctional enzyme CysN/CysC
MPHDRTTTRRPPGQQPPSATVNPSEPQRFEQHQYVSANARTALKGHRSGIVWLTGLSGAGKSTIANHLELRLHADGVHTTLLDGDNIRRGLNRDLGFSDEDRVENIRRVAEVARLMADSGLVVIVAFISPFRADRRMARDVGDQGCFCEVFVDTPLHVAEARDPKGLYRKARKGELVNFTGVDSPYERPDSPELRIDTTVTSPSKAADRVVELLRAMQILGR